MGTNPKKNKRNLSCLIWIVISPLLAIGLCMAMGALLVVADPLEPADAIVVLSGGSDQRMQEAILLYQEKYAQTIILTETGAVLKNYDNAQYSSEQRLVLINADIPASAIWITPKHSASTRDEAKDVRTLVENKNIHNLIVVTDSYHTLRTRLIWNEVFHESEINIIVRPARGSWYKSTTWWLSPTGWETTLNEYVKLTSYLIMRKVE